MGSTRIHNLHNLGASEGRYFLLGLFVIDIFLINLFVINLFLIMALIINT